MFSLFYPIETFFCVVDLLEIDDFIRVLLSSKYLWSNRLPLIKRWISRSYKKKITKSEDIVNIFLNIKYNTDYFRDPEFEFCRDLGPISNSYIIMKNMGPKLLVSNRSTRDNKLVLSQFRVFYNTAIVIGALEDLNFGPRENIKHMLQSEYPRSISISSRSTVAVSPLTKVEITHGTLVSVYLAKGYVKFMINLPNKNIIQMKFNTDPDRHYRICLVLWAKAVLHMPLLSF